VAADRRHRVVIVGGGFGGMAAAKALGIDLGARTLDARVPDGDLLTIGYDSLIVAAGPRTAMSATGSGRPTPTG
jgi:hypothetical protein